MNQLLFSLNKELKKHYIDYLILITSGILFLLFLKLFEGYRLYSFIVLILFVAFYILWGTHHHYTSRDMHLKNIVEYIMIGFTIIFLLKVIMNF